LLGIAAAAATLRVSISNGADLKNARGALAIIPSQTGETGETGGEESSVPSSEKLSTGQSLVVALIGPLTQIPRPFEYRYV